MTTKIREALDLLGRLSDEAADLVREAEAEAEQIEQMMHDAHNGRPQSILAQAAVQHEALKRAAHEEYVASCKLCGHPRRNHRTGGCGVFVVSRGDRCPCPGFRETGL